VDQDVLSLVFSGLTQSNNATRLAPDMAERWSVSTDGRTYTYQLRSGMKWQDGIPVAADDVVYTVHAMQHPEYQGPRQTAEVWRNIQVEAPDPLTVRFSLPEPYSPFIEFSTLRIMPSHIWKAIPPAKHPESERNAMAIGSGPFKVKEANKDRILLEANPLFHRQHPLLSQVQFKFYPLEAQAAEALRKGEVQGLRRVGADDLASFKGDQRFIVNSSPEVSKASLLLFNNKNPLLSDKLIRKALALATNRQRIIDEALKGQATIATGPIAPSSWAYRPEPEPFDQALARTMLEHAGWKTLDAEGIRLKDGARLQFVLLTNDRPERVAIAQAVSRQWKEIGVKADVQTAGWSGFVKDFLVPLSFQIALAEYWSPNLDPDAYQFWHSSQIDKGLNFSAWTNRRADELLEDARRSADQGQREIMYREFQALFSEEQPSVMLLYPNYNYVVDKSVQGIKLPPMLSSQDRFESIDQWYSQTRRAFAR
jgi:peptide/nickel transport system substrate-binding protein